MPNPENFESNIFKLKFAVPPRPVACLLRVKIPENVRKKFENIFDFFGGNFSKKISIFFRKFSIFFSKHFRKFSRKNFFEHFSGFLNAGLHTYTPPCPSSRPSSPWTSRRSQRKFFRPKMFPVLNRTTFYSVL